MHRSCKSVLSYWLALPGLVVDLAVEVTVVGQLRDIKSWHGERGAEFDHILGNLLQFGALLNTPMQQSSRQLVSK